MDNPNTLYGILLLSLILLIAISWKYMLNIILIYRLPLTMRWKV